GRAPIAQPPGSDTSARPKRPSSGPSTSTDARIVFTSSYGATGSQRSPTSATISSPSPHTSTPIRFRSFTVVATSFSRGTLRRRTRPSARSAAASSGNAAFFAPDTRTLPFSGDPPEISNLSIASVQGRAPAGARAYSARPASSHSSGV